MATKAATPSEATPTSQARALVSGLIIAAIASANGAAMAIARANAKPMCPIPHNVANDSLRSRSAE
jgi:hypothetical protein